ncbi:Panacea domain-containing protein [Rhizobium sp. BK661]|uniref:Panacea domain-containing protein n=1 Tax=Rhizobium sp. BK661 TaxID=2586991 RepID=UPI0021673DEF|nr:type II toxin-antitoxin system antitoxin SocA domain-containing protein [Rhizobium sp. BK661]MCS3742001.1 putative phage-associated protein [Rhizobium sp. BK661]
MIRTFKAAKTLCELSHWQLSNLPLQKLLYLSHMYHLGEYGEPLIDGTFQAWDLGPVEPTLYRQVKAYGDKPIQDVFRVNAFSKGTTEHDAITEIYDELGDRRPSSLVAITHQDHGAWAKYYNPNVNGIVIPDRAIRQEFNERRQRAQKNQG